MVSTFFDAKSFHTISRVTADVMELIVSVHQDKGVFWCWQTVIHQQETCFF